MKKITTSILQIDLILQSIFWLGGAIYNLIKQNTGNIGIIILAILMIANALVFVLFAFVFQKKSLLVKIPLFIFLSVNMILSITDQIGFLDYAILTMNIIAIACLVFLHFSNNKE